MPRSFSFAVTVLLNIAKMLAVRLNKFWFTWFKSYFFCKVLSTAFQHLFYFFAIFNQVESLVQLVLTFGSKNVERMLNTLNRALRLS